MMKHIPVLLDAVVNALGDIRGAHIVDCTFGAGGYTRAFLNAGADVIAFDRDSTVVPMADEIKSEFGERFTFVPRPFSYLSELPDKYDAIVFDLGISSMQIDNSERGFSFRGNAPLDMRMDSSAQCDNAADLIKKLSVSELTQILRDYGDVSRAGILARAIKDKMPQTTFALRDLIYNPRDIAPVFQALRIAVNDEFGEIRRALSAVPDKLKTNGKCICVTFHSLEDRLVKNTFREWTTVPGAAYMPNVSDAPFSLIKPQTPTSGEVVANPRARSAHMRGVIKIREI